MSTTGYWNRSWRKAIMEDSKLMNQNYEERGNKNYRERVNIRERE